MVHLDAIRSAARSLTPTCKDRIGELVSCESPPGALPQLNACADLLAGWGEAILGRPAQRVFRDGLPHLLWPAQRQQVLLLGHFDTVWPAGTIDEWPYRVRDGIATGPGVCDMKGGIVQLFAALSLLTDPSSVGVLLTCDEETGSTTSRPLIEEQARRSGVVLVCEPSTEDGALKVARKGGSVYRVEVHGRAAHAGVEPFRGINATVELAHQVLAVQALASVPDGTTVTPTVAASGTTTNTVPEAASFSVDVRSWSRAELHRVDRMMHRLVPRLAEAGLTLRGGLNRYPMTRAVALPLLAAARSAAVAIGLEPPVGVSAPGASDGNFTAALGVPTLDGLGAVGGFPHGRGEYMDLRRMPERVAMLTALVERLLAGPLPPHLAPAALDGSPVTGDPVGMDVPAVLDVPAGQPG
ncbi:M20 family metallopeptidase [Micromonospora sp. NBC_01699]|uniref:M20 family metallopeptidase n=1 Tax=Micromonospora sp. NBC_01699 TaxID=2975984 RepID=UPI002E296707|nr:M20 family metallopeptidase [Micromonospora sp. NBC_01699]